MSILSNIIKLVLVVFIVALSSADAQEEEATHLNLRRLPPAADSLRREQCDVLCGGDFAFLGNACQSACVICLNRGTGNCPVCLCNLNEDNIVYKNQGECIKAQKVACENI